MADPQFEEFKVVFDKMPQYIKAPTNCYFLLALDVDALMLDESPESVDASETKKESPDGQSDVSPEEGESTKLKPPWHLLESGHAEGVSKRKRRKLPEIPSDKKPLGRLFHAPSTSLAEEINDSDHSVTNSPRTKPRVVGYSHYGKELEDSSPEDGGSKCNGDIDSGNSTAHSPDGAKSVSPITINCLSRSSSSTLSSTPSGSQLQLHDATHRGLHKFVPRHTDEMAVEIGDPIYVQKEGEDLWCEGVNLRSGATGIFPSAYVTDVDYSDFDPDGGKVKKERYLMDFLGSVEVGCHKGNDVLCQAVRKVARACVKDIGVHGPHACILEITDQGLRMVDHKKPLPNHVPMHDYFFNLKNVTFCGYHPFDHRYFGFITKHPLQQRFACHVFMGQGSTRDVAEAVGRAFHRFYYKFIETAYPIEDIYIE